MAETDAAAATTTPPTDTPSADSSTTAPPPPAKTEVKRWADEEDDPPEEPVKTEAPSTSETPELEVAALKITENTFLDDPEDSGINAVPAGDTPYTFRGPELIGGAAQG